MIPKWIYWKNMSLTHSKFMKISQETTSPEYSLCLFKKQNKQKKPIILSRREKNAEMLHIVCIKFVALVYGLIKGLKDYITLSILTCYAKFLFWCLWLANIIYNARIFLFFYFSEINHIIEFFRLLNILLNL